MFFSSKTVVFAGSLCGLQYQATASASWLAKKAYPGMLAHLIQYQYRSGMVNSNTVNSKFHLILSFFEIFARFL